ncbi:MAG: arginine--tRNA ligase [Eubacteriales bacterium]|nr:arginine--tRNA ligase [Eubacteriales bacterium]
MMDMKQSIGELIESALQDCYPGVENLPSAQEVTGYLEIPPEKEMGDYAFPCFKLSRALHMGPPQIASALAGAVSAPHLCEAKQQGGYLNFFLNRDNFAQKTLEAVLAAGERYGASELGKGKTVCLDFSSINIAKRFHIGHLSTTMIGQSLRRIYDFLGYRTVAINHLGDWGTQFGKLICAYKLWGDQATVEQKGVEELTRLYVLFHEEAEKNPALEDEGRRWFKAIEDGDEEAMSLFNWFKELTLRDTQRVYDLLGVTFDSYNGEAFYNDKMGRVIDELKAKNLLTLSEGASIVDLDEEKTGMPPCLILKKDGATLYATRDIAAALWRKDEYDFDKCLYVVAYQQDLHFRQWFKVIEKMGYPWYKDLVHVAFGMISYEGQSLSTRKGHVVYLEELLLSAKEKALKIIEEKSPELENKDEVARQVGIGAVIYADLQAGRIKDIDFSWDRALSFDGETGPYVQYTHARCCSVLRKAAEYGEEEPDYTALGDDYAQELLRQLSRFPEAVKDAADRYEPSVMTRTVTELCKAYNKFYYENRILNAEPGERAARLRLTLAAKNAIKTGLYLIGMEAPERM